MKQKPLVPKLKVLKQKHMKISDSNLSLTNDLKKNKKARNNLLIISLSSIFIISTFTIGYVIWSINNEGDTSLANLTNSTPNESSPNVGGGLIGGPTRRSSSVSSVEESSSVVESSSEQSSEVSSESSSAPISETSSTSSSEASVSSENSSIAVSSQESSTSSSDQSSLMQSLSVNSSSTPTIYASGGITNNIDGGANIKSNEELSVETIKQSGVTINEDDNQSTTGNNTTNSTNSLSTTTTTTSTNSVANAKGETVRSGGSSMIFSIIMTILLMSSVIYILIKNSKTSLKLRK